ncbi:MAG: hypothetical protein JRG95_22345 [Deltaproteobacteria bacterium]|nr:hypothetical protein [Deltaproteobacteria bacterium]
MRPKVSLLLIALALLIAGPLRAGTFLILETTRLADGKVLERTELRAEGSRLRLDTDGGRSSVIYLADQQTVRVLNHKKRSYLEVDQQTTESLARGLKRANQELRSRLEGLPASQREAAERLLNSTLGPDTAKATPEVVIVPTGGTDEIEGRACREFEVLKEGTRVADVCKADFAAVGIVPETLDGLRQLAGFLRESLSALAPEGLRGRSLDALDSFDQLDGVPLRVRAYERGEAVRQSRITEIETRQLPSSDFAVPQGYQKTVGLNVRDHIGAP